MALISHHNQTQYSIFIVQCSVCKCSFWFWIWYMHTSYTSESDLIFRNTIHIESPFIHSTPENLIFSKWKIVQTFFRLHRDSGCGNEYLVWVSIFVEKRTQFSRTIHRTTIAWDWVYSRAYFNYIVFFFSYVEISFWGKKSLAGENGLCWRF